MKNGRTVKILNFFKEGNFIARLEKKKVILLKLEAPFNYKQQHRFAIGRCWQRGEYYCIFAHLARSGRSRIDADNCN